MIVVENTVRIVEIDGKELADAYADHYRLRVISHWNDPNKVLFEISEGTEPAKPLRYAVYASDLEAAIKNATNSGRF